MSFAKGLSMASIGPNSGQVFSLQMECLKVSDYNSEVTDILTLSFKYGQIDVFSHCLLLKPELLLSKLTLILQRAYLKANAVTPYKNLQPKLITAWQSRIVVSTNEHQITLTMQYYIPFIAPLRNTTNS